MRNRRIIISLLLIFLFASCNMPYMEKAQPTSAAAGQIWNLDTSQRSENVRQPEQPRQSIRPTSTPQLVKAVDFDNAFIRSADTSEIPSNHPIQTGNDTAQWLFFDPAEYSSNSIDILYAVFENTGTSAWTFFSISQAILGIQPTRKGLLIRPCIPHAWKEFRINRRFRGVLYRITVLNPDGAECGIREPPRWWGTPKASRTRLSRGRSSA